MLISSYVNVCQRHHGDRKVFLRRYIEVYLKYLIFRTYKKDWQATLLKELSDRWSSFPVCGRPLYILVIVWQGGKLRWLGGAFEAQATVSVAFWNCPPYTVPIQSASKRILQSLMPWNSVLSELTATAVMMRFVKAKVLGLNPDRQTS